MCLKRWIGIGDAVLTWLWRIHREPSAAVMKGGEGGFAQRVWRDSGPSVQPASYYHTIDKPLACGINTLSHPARVREGQLWGQADEGTNPFSETDAARRAWCWREIRDTFPERSPGSRRTRVLAEHIVSTSYSHTSWRNLRSRWVLLLIKTSSCSSKGLVMKPAWDCSDNTYLRVMFEYHTLFKFVL